MVRQVNGDEAIIELTSKLKKISISKEFLKEVNMHELKGTDQFGNRNYSGAASQYHVGAKNAFGGGVS